MATQSDGREPGYLYRLRSLAVALIGLPAQLLQGRPTAALIGHLEYLVPRQVADVGVEPVPFETPVAHAKRRPLRFGDDPMQPAFHQGTQGHALFGRQLARLPQQGVGNFDRCLHKAHPYGSWNMGTHIMAKWL